MTPAEATRLRVALVALIAATIGIFTGVQSWKSFITGSIVPTSQTPQPEFPVLVVADDSIASVVQWRDLPTYLSEVSSYSFSIPPGREQLVAAQLARQTVEPKFKVDPLVYAGAVVESSDAEGQEMRTTLRWQSGHQVTGWYHALGKRAGFEQFQNLQLKSDRRLAWIIGFLCFVFLLTLGSVALLWRDRSRIIARMRTRFRA